MAAAPKKRRVRKAPPPAAGGAADAAAKAELRGSADAAAPTPIQVRRQAQRAAVRLGSIFGSNVSGLAALPREKVAARLASAASEKDAIGLAVYFACYAGLGDLEDQAILAHGGGGGASAAMHELRRRLDAAEVDAVAGAKAKEKAADSLCATRS